jgi:hypothetical protein
VRNSAGDVVQFLYGEDGMDAVRIEGQVRAYERHWLGIMLCVGKWRILLVTLACVLLGEVWQAVLPAACLMARSYSLTSLSQMGHTCPVHAAH